MSRTDWSMLGRAGSADQQVAAEAVERLVRRYWPAVYAFVRRMGRDPHAASDLTQAFVTEVILGRGLLLAADPAKGRFRHLLLRSLRNYLHEQHRHDTRAKRTPSTGVVVSLGLLGESLAARAESGTPEQAFDAAWCRTLVQRVLDQVREGCERDGLTAHWRIFEGRVVGPVFLGTAPIDYVTLAAEVGLPSSAHAANLLVTVKRRFARAMRTEIAETVADPAQVEAELAEMLALLEAR